MAQKKFECKIDLLDIVPYNGQGSELVARGYVVEEDKRRGKFNPGEYIHTSVVIKVDAEKRTIETLNTIYSY